MKELSTSLLFAIIATLLFNGAGKCFGQYDPGDEKIIIVQRNSPGPNQDSVKTYFRIDNKVRVKSLAYDKVFRGRITSISDSGFYLEDKLIRPADIISINRCRGRTNMYTGGSFLAGGGLLLGVILAINENNTTHVGQVTQQPISIIFEVALVAVMGTGYFVGISGAIANSLSWHYGNDIKTRIYIGTQKKVANKLREKTRNPWLDYQYNIPGTNRTN